MPKFHGQIISELEYESLPPTLQRKYFSSLERLRLAQDGSASTPKRPLRPLHHLRSRSSFAIRTKSFLGTLDSLSAFSHINPGHKFATSARSTPLAQTVVNPDTAAWFASLPSTVQRKHFTKEEQVLFANESHSIILDAADELLQKHNAASDTDLIYFAHYPPSQFDSLRSSIDTDLGFDPDEVSADMNSQQYLETMTWLSNDKELDLRLDDYHSAMAETTQRHAAAQRRQSNRRNLSLTNMSFRRSSISTPSKSAPRVPPINLNRLQTPTAPQSPLFHRASRASASAVDVRATYYQDPAARMKLRVYLASPSKFDEALEFGFPSSMENPSKIADRPQTSPRRLTNGPAQSFFPDDVPSLAGDDDSSMDEGDALSDPRTPESSEFRNVRRSQKGSVDRASFKPQIVRPEPYAHANTLDREMTIHMTLTRPDLRSPSDTRPPSRHINAQPLEQAPLPPMGGQSIWDTLPSPEESKVKKLWKKIKSL